MRFLYSLGVYFYVFLIKLFSLFNDKASLWVKGRRNIFENLRNEILSTDRIAWFHVASLGEFEQGRPVIEQFKLENPDFKVLLTFFSPSGYEVRKNYKNADFVFYLPYDSKQNAKEFLDIVNPQIVFFVKYEFWYFYLKTLNERNISTYLFSSIFREEQVFFKNYGKFYRNILRNFSHIFVQNIESKKLLSTININNVSVAGDTRFDTVVQNANRAEKMQKIIEFKNNKRIIIGGSTWQKDEDLLIQYINNTSFDTKFIIAPHEVKKSNIERIESGLKNPSLRFSKTNNHELRNIQTLIIDSIGILSSVYRYSDIAYIGNGFGKSGIHNTLEPGVFGNTIVFGPNFNKFKEAVDLTNDNVAFVIHNYEELSAILDKLQKNSELYDFSSEATQKYVQVNSGATKIILNFISK